MGEKGLPRTAAGRITPLIYRPDAPFSGLTRMHPSHTAFAESYSFAIYDTLLVQLWRANATLEGIQTMRRLILEAGKVEAMLIIVDDFKSLPSEAVREEIVLLAREIGAISSMIIYGGTGFKAAALRALVTGVFALTRQRHVMGVFGAVSEAHAWAGRQRLRVPDLRSMEAMVAGLREKQTARAA